MHLHTFAYILTNLLNPYMHIHTHTHTYINMHTYIHLHIHIFTYTITYTYILAYFIHAVVHTYTYIHIHTHTYTYIHIHTHTYTYIHVCIHTYAHILYMRTYTHIHIQSHTYTYIHLHTHTYYFLTRFYEREVIVKRTINEKGSAVIHLGEVYSKDEPKLHRFAAKIAQYRRKGKYRTSAGTVDHKAVAHLITSNPKPRAKL